MSRQTMYIVAAVVAVLVLLYVFGVFGGGEVTASTSPAPATDMMG